MILRIAILIVLLSSAAPLASTEWPSDVPPVHNAPSAKGANLPALLPSITMSAWDTRLAEDQLEARYVVMSLNRLLANAWSHDADAWNQRVDARRTYNYVVRQLIVIGTPKPQPPAAGGGGGDYVPPMGIPAPSFGIDQVTPVAATKCGNWPAAASPGCFYVDKGHVSATDTSNTQGYPNKPRLTIPNAHVAGDYVEIHGDGGTGTYKYDSFIRPTGVGTAENPIWFVGVNNPYLTWGIDLGFSNQAEVAYMIFEGLWFREGAIADIRPRFDNNNVHDIAIRKSSFVGRQAFADASAISVGTLSGATRTTSRIVLYDNEIRDYGDFNNPGEEVGVYAVGNLDGLWVLDNDISGFAEDGIAGGHGADHSVKNYYIGRNKIFQNLTNGIDLKAVDNIIVSENEISEHYDVWVAGVQKSSGQGESVGFHYAGNSTGPDLWNNFPKDVSFLFNELWGSRFGYWTSIIGKQRIVGNVIHTMVSAPTGPNPNTVDCIFLNGLTADTWVVNNTTYGCDGNFRVTDVPAAYDASTHYLRNNKAFYNNKVWVCYAAGCQYITHTGTMQSATSTTMVLDAAANYADDELNGMWIVITSGASINVQVLITDYNGATDTATVDWPNNINNGPTGTPTYALYAGSKGIAPDSDPTLWREIRLYIRNNIFAGRVEAAREDVDFDSFNQAEYSTDMDYNLMHHSGGERIFYGSGTVRDLQWLKDNTPHCDNCLNSDPLFTNPATFDFTLQATSPAKNTGSEGTPSVYDDFFNTYGRSIRFDRAGLALPRCGSWHIGAYAPTSC